MSAPLPTLALTLSEPPVTGKTEITSSDAQLIEEESGFSELLTDQLSATAKTLIATSAELLPEAAEWMEIPDGGSILPPDTAIAAIPVVDVTLRTTMAAAYGSDKQGVPVEIIPRQAATMVMDRNGKLVGSPLHGTGAFMVAEAIPDHSVKPEIVSWASTSPDLARSDQGATLNSSITHKLSSESVLSTGDFIRTDPVRNETPRVPEILPEQFKIPEEVAGRRWGEAVNSRITWMAGNSIQHAELRLNPPELGPLEVRISVNREDASIQFTALHPSVREALETALPRLRDMLQENGLNLAQVGVSGQGAGNDGREASDTATENRMENSGESSDLLEQELEKTPGGVRASRGLIDAYV